MIHPVEMPFQCIHVSGPEPPELRQPGIDLLERLGLEPIKPALCVHRGFYETGLAQYPQVLGHGGLGHMKPALDLSHRLF